MSTLAAAHDAASDEKRPDRPKGRLIVVQGGFPSLSATFILDQITGLIDRGWNIENWATRDSKEATQHDAIRAYDLLKKTKYLRFPKRSLASDTDQWMETFCEQNALGSLEDVAAFHIHYGNSFNALAPLFRFLKTFVVVSFHGYDASRTFQRRGDACYEFLFERADLITTPTQRMKDELVRRGCPSEKVVIHRYGVDLDEFAPPREKQFNVKPIYLTVARLVEKKGIEYSLRAFARIADRLDAEYRIIGEGPLRCSLQDLAHGLGVEKRVKLLGGGTKEVVRREMSQADIFVLSSVTAEDGDMEGLPVALIEAQAMGLPAISTHHAGIPELIVDGSTGFLAPEKDVDRLTEIMGKLAGDSDLRKELSQKARERVCGEFNIRALNDRLSARFQSHAGNSDALGSPPTSVASNLDHPFHRAHELLAANRISEAIRELDQNVAFLVNDADLMVCIGDLHVARSNSGAAKHAYSRALLANPNHAGAQEKLRALMSDAGLKLSVTEAGKACCELLEARLAAMKSSDGTRDSMCTESSQSDRARIGSRKSLEVECPVCESTFAEFLPHGVPPRPNARCPQCKTLERHRLLWYYLKTQTPFFLQRLKVLDVAPKKALSDRIRALPNIDYLSIDLNSPLAMRHMDITALELPDNSFDVIFCYHVLEHIPDDAKAMKELFRVLKPGGWAILQVPLNRREPTTHEGRHISDPVERLRLFGQADHCRLYGLDYKDRLAAAGFAVKVDPFVKHLPPDKITRFGLSRGEDIYFCSKGPVNAGSAPETLKDTLERCGWSSRLPLYEPLLKSVQVFRKVERPAISVVMITNNFTDEVRKHIGMLAAERHLNYEFIFVDNGAGIGSLEDLSEHIDVVVTLTRDTGAYLARNVGAAFARAPILFFLEDDGIPGKNLIQAHLDAFDRYDVISVRGVYLPKTATRLNELARHYWLGDNPFPFFVNLEGNASYLASAFYAVGGWDDEILFGHGGPELACRLTKYEPDRRKQIYSPAPVIRHDYARSPEHLEKKRAKQEQSRERLRKKHPDFDVFVKSWSMFKGHTDSLIPRRRKDGPCRPSGEARGGPLITIAMPTFNRAQLLSDAIQSALEQTYQNFEIVVVDDGSTDETAAVMNRITDPRVRFIVKEHSGGPATRNRCIAEARGEFLLWLDSDDALLPNTLEFYVAAIQCHPDVDVFYGNLLAADERLRVQEVWAYNDYHGWHDTLVGDLIVENRIPNVAALVRKSCYEKVGGYNPDFPRAHDYEFWARLALVATMKSVHADTGIYRRHEESLSKLRNAADTSYEANVVKTMLDKHELSGLFPFCYAAGAPVHNGDARAWLIVSLIMAQHGDLAAAVEFAKRSADGADLGRNKDIFEILQMVAGGNGSRPSVKTEPRDEFTKLVAVAKKRFAAGQARECAQACSQLTELRPETVETLLLVALSLRRWGKPQEARAAFRCLVRRQCEDAHLQAVTEAETFRRNQPEPATDSAAPAERLASLLSPFFGGERIPAQAVQNALSFIAAAPATDAREYLETHREKQTPLFFALLGLTADELGRCVDAAVTDQITRLRAAQQPPSPSTQKRLEGYSFCIITGGQRRAKLKRQIASIRALGLPNFEILVAGDVSDVPDGVQKVDMAGAAFAGRLGKMRNALAKLARFDHLVVSDDDIVFDEKFGDGLKRFGEGYDAMAVRVVNPDGSRFWDWATTGGTKGSVLLDYWDADPYVYITGGMCVLKTGVLERVAWDDSRGFYEREDVDFSERLNAAGIAIRFNTFCKVLHDDDRYLRVNRCVFRFDHLLGYALERHQTHEREAARRFLAAAVRVAGTYPDRIVLLKDVAARIGEQNYLARLMVEPAPQSTHRQAGDHMKINWIGSFLDNGSLSHVNREITGALEANSDFELRRVSNETVTNVPADAAVTVRHAWPPDWKRPRHGKLVVIQPWEFGALPETWVRQARDVDEFWVPSNFVRNAYVKSGVPAQKVFVVPNGVDTERFHPQAAPMKLATQKRFKFLFVGGTIFRKGPDVLLKAYLESFTAADDVCLVIKDFGGQGVYAGQTFASQIHAAQSQPNAPEILYLNDEWPPDSMPGLYTACDCLVHPYRGEGFGLPVLEAMACGLPVIVTAGGAADDFAGEGFAYRIPATKKSIGDSISDMKLVRTGWLLEPDASALAARMKWVVEHREDARATGQRASEHARCEWTWERAAQIAAERLRDVAQRVEQHAAAKAKKVELPAVAWVGHVDDSRDRQKLRAALDARPFHPQARKRLKELGEPMPAANDPRLTICLIAKNEERFLAQCLRSVKAIAWQIVVVDTGSTDRTKEIAREFGAEVYDFPWCDDFSAARNAALEHARGDWVLVLDADEELTAKGAEILRREMQDAKAIAYRLPIVDVGNEAEGHSYVPRLFRNAPGLFYVGRIHEQVFSSIEVRRREWGMENKFSKATLLHHGYTAEMTRERDKNTRNLRLLERAIEEMPDEPNLLMNYASELARAGKPDAALDQYREAFRAMAALPANQVTPELRESLLTQLCTQLIAAKKYGELVQMLDTPLAQRGGLTASLHFGLGLVHMELKNFREAAEQFRQCLAKRDQPVLAPMNRDIRKAGPHHCLATCLMHLREFDAAGEAFQRALAADPESRRVRFDFAKFLFARGLSVEALTQLHTLVSEKADERAVWLLGGQISLSQPEFLDFACDWTGEAVKYCPQDHVVTLQRAEALLLAGKAEEARLLWARTEADERSLAAGILCALAVREQPRPVPASLEMKVSREFVGWYQRLLRWGAGEVIASVNENVQPLRNTLPTAAATLDAALAEAERAAFA